ncbi:MAG: S8 family peptidase [Steroidobacterales bacterium]
MPGEIMYHWNSVRLSVSIAALLASGASLPSALSPAQTKQLAEGAERDVIVILRDQLPNMPGVRGARTARAAALGSAQSPVIAHLQQSGARNVRSFKLINAVAAHVSRSEADALAAHPLVQAVVADATIRMHKKSVYATGAAGRSDTPASSANGLCNTLEPEALQLTNTAFGDVHRPQAQQVLDGNGWPVTGRGVRVAFLADGLDPTLPGFMRPDGTSVFYDYQDFSGDPAGTPTAGGEAFGDASSIAAQDRPNGKPLLFDISQFVNAAHPLPSPCNIRIRGVAPGASLVGLKVFSNLGYTTTSTFVQAIEYAVVQDDVDVVNESFGGNPFPDNANDPISLANNVAVKAGVTVVVSTGDAGTAGTVGSPATEHSVIAAGASTQFRFYAQTGYGGQPFATGYLDNNISSFSSGGFAQSGARTVDVVAPGDLSWALCSTDTSLYGDCTSFVPAASPIESFGGSSESAPLTSGEAALVIQAYRSTHRSADPSPALVKQIIMSTATDLGAPASEQGAGLINSLAAVQAALSVQDGNGRPRPQGDSLLSWPTSASVTAMPNRHADRSFTITNTGISPQHLKPALQTLGPAVAGATLNLTMNPATDPTFLNVTGSKRSYIEQTFIVPKGVQHLDAAIAWQNPLSSSQIAYLGLLDPSGKDAAYTIPQGANSGYGHVDVVDPAPGQWTRDHLGPARGRRRELRRHRPVHVGRGKLRRCRIGASVQRRPGAGRQRDDHGRVGHAVAAG